MSTVSNNAPETPPPPLQFDRAELTSSATALTCAQCGQPIAVSYFDIGGKSICDPCRHGVFAGSSGGFAIFRPIVALLLGLIAALVGAAIYYGILKLTGYELGLIALVVGVIVGIAVRVGSGGRGGWLYQTLAVMLTYLAIAISYGAMTIEAMIAHPEMFEQKVEGADGNPSAVTTAPADESELQDIAASAPSGESASQSIPESAPTTSPTTSPTTAESTADPGESEPLSILVGLLYLFIFILSLPILVGVDSPISLLIIGFALFQAWRINVRTKVTILGPFRVGSGGAAPHVS